MTNRNAGGQFLQGVSGNPGGRPKGLAALVQAETRDGEELVAFMLGILRGRRRAGMQLRMDAARWLADRGFGKPVQTTELSGPEGGAVQLMVAGLGLRQSDDGERGCST